MKITSALTDKHVPRIAAAVLMAMVMASIVDAADTAGKLAAPGSFASISDAQARSAALFTEAGKVLTHPRCVNCHPAGDRPLQTDSGHLHQTPVERGTDGFGLAPLTC